MATIEEAKNLIKESPISSVIGYYHPLSKKGANYSGICPFHGDTTPSLIVSDQKGMYKCFACDAGGDAIGFVMDRYNLEFIEAIKDISGKMGITVEEKKYKKNPKFDMAFRVLASAQKIYKKFTTEQNPKEFPNFLKHRNLNEESVENFGLTYSPGNNALLNYLQNIPADMKDKAIAVGQEMGIIRSGDRGQYDFFRKRIMFPIWDHSGNIRGFSSRATNDDQVPKYLNSGESFIFNKGNILYGFHLAKSHIRSKDSVIIVEGNMDAVMLHQYGFQNSVATMGTALSDQSISLLSNMTKNIYLAMDSDAAGLSAMKRINVGFLRQKVFTKYVNFHPSKDPDEFLNEFGRLELQKRLDEAPSFLDTVLDDLMPEARPDTVEQKLQILNLAFEILEPLGEDLMAKEKAISTALKLGMKATREDIIEAYKEFLAKNKSRHAPVQTIAKIAEEEHEYEYYEEENLIANAMPSEPFHLNPSEKVLIEQIVLHPLLLEHSKLTDVLDLMVENEVKRLIKWIQTLYFEIDEDEYQSVLSQKISQSGFERELINTVNSSLFNFEKRVMNKDKSEKLLNDLGIRIKQSHLRVQRENLKQKQRDCRSSEEETKLMTEIQSIQQQLNELKI